MPEAANEPEEQGPAQSIVQLTILLPEKPAKAGFPVTDDERIYEVAETLGTFPSTKAYTSFNLKYKGKVLPPNMTISEITSSSSSGPALASKDSEYAELTLTMSDAPYTERKARDHVIKVREMAALEIPSFQEGMHSFSGAAAGASTYANLALDEVKEPEEEQEKQKQEEGEDEKKKKEEEKPAVSDQERKKIDQELEKVLDVHSNASEFAASSSLKLKPALHSLSVSAWTPALQKRQLQGDLFYLVCQTLEGETFHITANVKGFFVNKSSANRFDGHERILASASGKSSQKKSKAHSLVTLLQSLSPKFVEQLEANRNAIQQNATETFVIPSNCYLANPWLVKQGEEPRADLGRSQYSYLHYDLKGDTITDWNQQFQDLKDLPQDSLQEAINRDEVLNNLTFEFTTAAVQGAIAAIKGDLAPMNPEESKENHIFLKNGIFYSFPTDLTKEFAETGGDEAARVAATRDLVSVRLLNKLNVTGISYLMTTIIDYYGHRVVCQTPAPGIFTKIPEADETAGSELTFPEIIKHGIVDQGKTLLTDPEISKKMESVADEFHLKAHKVWIASSKDASEYSTYSRTKGVKGTDGRDYMIDLYRTTPLDIEFIEKYYDQSKEDSYPFSEVTLRHEAVDEWWRRQASAAIKKEAERLEKEKKESSNGGDKQEAEKQTIAVDPKSFALNPDAFSLPKAPTEELQAQQKKDEDEVREASKFVQNVLIPEFLEEFEKTDTFLPLDGSHLTSIMHDQGINMRYLGAITRLVDERITAISNVKEDNVAKIAKENAVIGAELEKEEKEIADEMKKVMQTKKGEEAKKEIEKLQAKQQEREEERQKKQSTEINSSDPVYSLRTVKRICIDEAVSRSTKHYLRKALEKTSLVFAPYVISHIHNCLLTPSDGPAVEPPKIDPELKELYNLNELAPVLKKSAEEVRSEIARIAHIRFRVDLPEGWAEKLHPLVILSNIAKKFGIQWKSRDYAFTAEQLQKQISLQKAAIEEKKAQAKSESVLKKSRKNKNKKKLQHQHQRSSEPEEETVIQTTMFVPEDVVGLVPIIKDAPYESDTAAKIWAGAVESSQTSDKPSETLQLFQEGLATYEQIYGSIHPLTASAVSDLSRVLSKLNQPSGAIGLQRKAFQIIERVWGLDSYRTVLALNRMALYETENGQHADALKIYRRALNHWLVSYGDDTHPTVLSTLTSIAALLQSLKLNEEASKTFEKAIELSDRTHGSETEVSGLLHFQLAQTLIAQNKSAEAADECEKAYTIFKPVLGLNNVFTAQARNWYRGLRNYLAEAKIREEYVKKVTLQKAKEEKSKKTAHAVGRGTKHAKKHAEPEKKRKTKQDEKVSADPEIADKSVDEIMKYINSGSAPQKSKKHHHHK